MYMENITKHEALEKCKELISGTAIKPTAAEQLTKVSVLTKMFTYFKNAVHNSKPAQEYLQSRGLDATKIEGVHTKFILLNGATKQYTLDNSLIFIFFKVVYI